MINNVKIIGITGVTCGGKTSIANLLNEKLQKLNYKVKVIHQDNYYKDENEIEIDSKTGFVKWDCPEAFDEFKMMTDVRNDLKVLEKISTQKSVLVIEGILIFAFSSLNQIFHHRYSLSLPYDVAFQRRRTRIYDPPDLPGHFEEHVWPEHLKYKNFLQQSDFPYLNIDATKSYDQVLLEIVKDLNIEVQTSE